MGELLNRMASAAEDVEIMHDEPGDYSLDANVLFFGCQKGMGGWQEMLDLRRREPKRLKIDGRAFERRGFPLPESSKEHWKK